jgi:hypothetical protein
MMKPLSTAREYLACTGPDYLGQVKIIETFMEKGVGPARYGI